jgi:hypothetical protein
MTNPIDFVTKREVLCGWQSYIEDDCEVWSTDCGNEFLLTTDGTPFENGFKYCCYCGKRIREVLE